eukprot:m.10309 g.10309  ORF g.10309 m.10309 type:complete len:582 (+) comp22175_c0_seq2:37-1782(+)
MASYVLRSLCVCLNERLPNSASFLNYLYSNDPSHFLTSDDLEQLKSKPRSEAIDSLLLIIVHQARPGIFALFCHALQLEKAEHALRPIRAVVETILPSCSEIPRELILPDSVEVIVDVSLLQVFRANRDKVDGILGIRFSLVYGNLQGFYRNSRILGKSAFMKLVILSGRPLRETEIVRYRLADLLQIKADLVACHQPRHVETPLHSQASSIISNMSEPATFSNYRSQSEPNVQYPIGRQMSGTQDQPGYYRYDPCFSPTSESESSGFSGKSPTASFHSSHSQPEFSAGRHPFFSGMSTTRDPRPICQPESAHSSGSQCQPSPNDFGKPLEMSRQKSHPPHDVQSEPMEVSSQPVSRSWPTQPSSSSAAQPPPQRTPPSAGIERRPHLLNVSAFQSGENLQPEAPGLPASTYNSVSSFVDTSSYRNDSHESWNPLSRNAGADGFGDVRNGGSSTLKGTGFQHRNRIVQERFEQGEVGRDGSSTVKGSGQVSMSTPDSISSGRDQELAGSPDPSLHGRYRGSHRYQSVATVGAMSASSQSKVPAMESALRGPGVSHVSGQSAISIIPTGPSLTPDDDNVDSH